MLLATLRKYHKQTCCVYCKSKSNLTIDHIVPKSQGGANHIGNYQVLCKKCNENKKATMPPSNTFFEGVSLEEIWTNLVTTKYKKQNLGSFLSGLLFSSVGKSKDTFSIIPKDQIQLLIDYCKVYGIDIEDSISIKLFDKTASRKFLKTFNPNYRLTNKANACYIEWKFLKSA